MSVLASARRRIGEALRCEALWRVGFSALSFVFVALMFFRSGQFELDYQVGDAAGYVELSRLDLFSLDFWTNYRLPLFLLLIKALRQDVYEVAFVEQALFAAGMIYFVRQMVQRRALAPPLRLGFALVAYAVALHPVTSYMHHELMTETLFYAEVLFFVGALIGPSGTGAIVTLAVAGGALCLTREEGVILVVLLLPAAVWRLAGDGLAPTLRRLAPLLGVVALAAALIVARAPFATPPSAADPLHMNLNYARSVNLTLARVAYDPAMTRYFLASGMPDDGAWLALKGYSAFDSPPGGPTFGDCMAKPGSSCAWIFKHGQKTYLRYLVTHPWRWLDAFAMRKPQPTAYPPFRTDMTLAYAMSGTNFRAIWQYVFYDQKMPLVSPVILALGSIPFAATLAAFAASLSFLAWPSRRREDGATPLVALGLMGGAMIAYHGDAVDQLRHLTTYVLMFRLMALAIVAQTLRLRRLSA